MQAINALHDLSGEAKHKIAAITIGQSPRTDITTDILPLLSPNIQLCEYGALDEIEASELLSLFHCKSKQEDSQASGGDPRRFLVSRLRDGSEVFFPEEDILPLVQACITRAELNGCEASILFCTGVFPPFAHSRPIIVPRDILYALLRPLVGKRKLGILFPNQVQVHDFMEHLEIMGNGLTREQVLLSAASPYQDKNEVIRKAKALSKDNELALIYLDCMGYSLEMKEEIEEATGLPVLLPRTILARILNELF